MNSRVSCIPMQGWFKRQIPTVRREGFFFFTFFLPFFPAFCHGIRLMRETFIMFSSLLPLLPGTEDWPNSRTQTQTTHLCHSSHISHPVKGFAVRKGTDEMLKTVKLCYIYRCSHLFYMCLLLWREPECSVGMFSIGVAFFLLGLSVIHLEFNIFFLFHFIQLWALSLFTDWWLRTKSYN